MAFLTKQNRLAQVGDLMRNAGDGAKVMEVTAVHPDGNLTVKSYGRVVAGKWSYAKRPRNIPLKFHNGKYYSPGGMVWWEYQVVKAEQR